MKLHFESDLPYQAAAIEAVCDLFRGQEVCRSVFTVTAQALADSGTYNTSYVVLLQQSSCKLLIYKTANFWLIFIGCSIG